MAGGFRHLDEREPAHKGFQCPTVPQELYKSLTWDRATEMHGHKRFTMATDIQVCFCDPQSPWQRCSNEDTNGLLLQIPAEGHRHL